MDPLKTLADDPDLLMEYWDEKPLLTTVTRDFSDILDLKEIESMLSRGVPERSLRVFEDGSAAERGGIFHPRERGGRTRERVATASGLAEVLSSGCTVLLEEVQTFSPGVARFADEFTRATGFETYCVVFITPPGHSGVKLHYDVDSVFLLQLHGSKSWRLHAPTAPYPLRQTVLECTTEPVLETDLDEGECLYIPRGYWHAGTARGSASVHLSIGVRTRAWLPEVLRELERRAGADPELRRSLTPHPAQDDRDDSHLFDRLTALVREIPSPRATARQLSRPAPHGWLGAAIGERRAAA
ncbi:cupin domain-containing protein [Glycomyces sp. L485]|uniref:cupin domain-containing protein n=1 Tax=Glycomyces sp. L485 TaxID=2909235 RepID=UPI001F4A5BEA|nr:cupin domain-containing protein [Glycomyces sp. L485]MCH7232157.1 cupin domain-containing protein [Glycomyces sp. L485]